VTGVRRQLVDDLVGFWYASARVRGFKADGQKALAKTKELQEQVWGVGHAQGVGPMLQICHGLECLWQEAVDMFTSGHVAAPDRAEGTAREESVRLRRQQKRQ